MGLVATRPHLFHQAPRPWSKDRGQSVQPAVLRALGAELALDPTPQPSPRAVPPAPSPSPPQQLDPVALPLALCVLVRQWRSALPRLSRLPPPFPHRRGVPAASTAAAHWRTGPSRAWARLARSLRSAHVPSPLRPPAPRPRARAALSLGQVAWSDTRTVFGVGRHWGSAERFAEL